MAREAATRFRRLDPFSRMTVDQVTENREDVKLKHAPAAIALEEGYGSWRELKNSAEATGREMYGPKMDVFLNHWFARYEDARASLEDEGGFLFPYDRQFFVAEESAIRILGLDPRDLDWGRIGRDWTKPKDLAARTRLKEKREQAM